MHPHPPPPTPTLLIPTINGEAMLYIAICMYISKAELPTQTITTSTKLQYFYTYLNTHSGEFHHILSNATPSPTRAPHPSPQYQSRQPIYMWWYQVKQSQVVPTVISNILRNISKHSIIGYTIFIQMRADPPSHTLHPLASSEAISMYGIQ